MKLYGYRQCSTCRKAQQWLRDHGHDDSMQPIRDTPPSERDMRAMLRHLGGNRKRLINTSSKDYRESGLKDDLDGLSDGELIARLHGNGNLIKRPFLLTANGGITGFDPEAWATLLASGK